MATKNEALLNKMADDFGGNFDGGTLTLKKGDGTVLATFTFAATAFGNASAGLITLAGVPRSATGVAAGDAATADLESSGAKTYKLTGLSVGTSNAHAVVDNVNVNIGQTVNLISFTWQEPATIADPE